MNPPKIILATKNTHKLLELRFMLGIPEDRLLAASEYKNAPDVEENGTTFEENALIKARALRDFTGEWTIADDSGLEVEILNNAPGVYSARYAGVHGDDAGNNNKLIAEMEKAIKKKVGAIGNTDELRRGCFVCAIALVSPTGQEFVQTGRCYGTLLNKPRGNNGFGYDPLFLPSGYDKTFAELSYEQKCQFSHRAVATKKLKSTLDTLFP